MTHVLVTGATGQIGSEVVSQPWLLTLSAAWQAAMAARHAPLTQIAFEVLLVVSLVVLGIFSLYWRVAGMTLTP